MDFGFLPLVGIKLGRGLQTAFGENEKALPLATAICSPRTSERPRKESPSRLCGRLALPLFRDLHEVKQPIS